MEAKPIPAFYCCYLLRSTIRHASIYVGSTPSPVRRLAQHNGLAKGGAVRTSRSSLRPWEMTCIVSGFKSQVAALQFEWAWQNCHLTRHITPEERISFATTKIKRVRGGGTRKKPGRPRMGMKDKLANLHILLRSEYFGKWPLRVRFFNGDVHEMWRKCCREAVNPIREDIQVVLDVKKVEDVGAEMSSGQKRRRKEDDYGKGGIEGLDDTYSSFRCVLEKSHFLIADGETPDCAVCQSRLALDRDLVIVCMSTDCNALSHVSCLSKHFLQTSDKNALLPDKGPCPSCNTLLSWQDLMTETTLRLRAPKAVQKLLRGKKRGAGGVQDFGEETEDEAEVDAIEAGDGLTAEDIAERGEDRAQDVDSEDDTASVKTSASELSPLKKPAKRGRPKKTPPSVIEESPTKSGRSKKKPPSVIEESDWEGAEIIE